MAASMGAVLLAAGAEEKRYSLPHSRVMIHQPWGGVQGQAVDIKIHAEEIMRIRKMLNEWPVPGHSDDKTIACLFKKGGSQ